MYLVFGDAYNTLIYFSLSITQRDISQIFYAKQFKFLTYGPFYRVLDGSIT